MSDDAFWIGPCPVDEFLSTFLDTTHIPTTEAKPRVTPRFFAKKNLSGEEHIRKAFGEFINERKVAPGFELIDTSSSHDPNSHPDSRVKPGGNLYRTSATAGCHRNQMDKVCLLCEFKFGESNDIFVVREVDEESLDNDDEDDDGDGDDEVSSEAAAAADLRERNKAQIVACLVEMAARQHRTHIFMLFVFHPYARLIRWDRSGIIITEKFSYVDNCLFMVDFFWCFSQVSEAQRGCDMTVTLASKEEATHTRKYLFAWAPLDGVCRDIYKISVPSEGSETRCFLAWNALAEPSSLFGRGTKGWPALEVKSGLNGPELSTKPVFVKEQWRGKSVAKEVDKLKLLNKAGVDFVPTLVCGGNLDGDFQTTWLHDHSEASWRVASKNSKNNKKAAKMEMRIHVRLVTAEVGSSLDCFVDSRQMLSAVYDAFKGHKQAYTKCGLLHRDISGGNILILPSGKGLLIDWDFAVLIDEIKLPKNRERTGTWPFMSIDLLSGLSKLHTVRDDIESFFWVVLFYGLHFIRSTESKDPHQLKEKIKLIFYTCNRYGEELPSGGTYKSLLFSRDALFFLTRPWRQDRFQFINSPSLNTFVYQSIARLRKWQLETSVATDSYEEDKDELWYADPLSLKHVAMEDLFEAALSSTSEWPQDGGAVDQLTVTSPQEPNHHISAKRKAGDSDGHGHSKKIKKSSD
ncbi:hypothetical protein ONZ45_g145 [Pleurotus djamor]|nr:hypothetical protein ONZ45_g145 [Pleurotus djamor]